MRILTVCYEYPPIGGGGATVCQGLSQAFVDAGHEVDVVTSGMKGIPEREKIEGVQIHRVACWRRQKHYATAIELLTQIFPSYHKSLELIGQHHYDINHCHFVVPSGIVARLIWKRTGLPYVLTAHGSDIPGYNPDRFELLHRIIRPLWSRIIRDSHALITPSHFLQDLIQHTVKTSVTVIPNGFNPPITKELPRQNRVLVVTRMFERKGVQHLIRAMAQIETDWEICIAGDGPYLSTLKTLAANLNVPVRFLGHVPRDRLGELYRSSKVFVFPSVQENFPVVLLEAMAAGCAIVTTGALGCAEVVGDSAILTETANVESLRDVLAGLLIDDAMISRLSKLAYARAAQFGWMRIAREYQSVFAECLAPPTGRDASDNRKLP